MGEGRAVHRFLVGKPEGKRQVGRPRRRWEDNIKMDLQEVGGACGDWMELAQDRDRWRTLVSTLMNLRVPKMRGISWLAAEPVSFSRRTLLHGVSKWVTHSPEHSVFICNFTTAHLTLFYVKYKMVSCTFSATKQILIPSFWITVHSLTVIKQAINYREKTIPSEILIYRGNTELTTESWPSQRIATSTVISMITVGSGSKWTAT